MKNWLWHAPVREVYDDLEQLKDYDRGFSIVNRCGFNTAEELWEANPVIGGGFHANDFGLYVPNPVTEPVQIEYEDMTPEIEDAIVQVEPIGV